MIKWIEPDVGRKDLQLVKKCILDNYINDGNIVSDFEKKCQTLLDVKYASTTTSGTIAIYIALKVLNINKNHEVLLPNLSYIAAANAVSMTGAKPIFVETEKKSLLIDVNKLKKHLSKKTKAIMPVHVSGRGNNIMEIKKFAKKNKLFIIEDAAEAFYSKFKNKFLGTYGDIGCFSFSPNKIITTGQGGLLVTNNKKYFNLIKMFKNQGRFGIGTGGDDNHIIKGSNLRLTNLQAAIGISQLKELNKRAKLLKEHYLSYKKGLSKNKNITFFEFRNEELPLWTDIHYKKRNKLIEYLSKKKIDCRKFWLPMSNQKTYNNNPKKSIKDTFFMQLFWLPSSFNLDNTQKKYICEMINNFSNKYEK